MTQKQISEVKTVQRDLNQDRRFFSLKAAQWIWLILGIIESLIGLRVVLKFIGANPDNPFANFIYSLSDLFLFPFAGLVATPTSGAIILEISSIIAMLVYALLAWGIERIVQVALYRPKGSSTVGITKTMIHEEPDTIIEQTTHEEYSE